MKLTATLVRCGTNWSNERVRETKTVTVKGKTVTDCDNQLTMQVAIYRDLFRLEGMGNPHAWAE